MCVLAGLAATGIGQAVAVAGTAMSALGAIYQGRATQAAAQQQSAGLEAQKQQTMQLASIEETRMRQNFRTQINQQTAELGARGFDLGSPTAQYLARQAGQEMAFAGQAIRQNAQANRLEITQQQQALEMQGRSAMMMGKFSAAGTVLRAAPDLWPDLLS